MDRAPKIEQPLNPEAFLELVLEIKNEILLKLDAGSISEVSREVLEGKIKEIKPGKNKNYYEELLDALLSSDEGSE